MTDARIVLTTTDSREEAEKIANALVHRQLAACVNIVGPITSIYSWKGKVENAQEFLLLIKTTEDAFEPLRDAVRELHSYELPEFIELGISRGEGKYLAWITQSVHYE
ncbi:MAG TPA: divalent-cation tolerance protein CutA [Terriglobales bacterium]|nr:divalent-cation tolerance protein CutA [Terriglobales bacterium]